MRVERVRPVDQAPETARTGLQLVPARKAVPAQSPQSPVPATETGEAHPMVPVLIAGLIAFTGAVAFVGLLMMWLLVRNTGVNWMFQTF